MTQYQGMSESSDSTSTGRRPNLMTKEEEQDMDAMRAQRSGSRLRSGSFRFESNDQSSGSSEPSSSQIPNNSHIHQHSSRLRIGYADTRGKRGSMEDEIAIVGRLRNKYELLSDLPITSLLLCHTLERMKILLQCTMAMEAKMCLFLLLKLFTNTWFAS